MSEPETGAGPASPKPRRDWVLELLKIMALPVTLAIIGFFTQSYLKEKEQNQANYLKQRDQAESRLRLYIQLLGGREQSESDLRTQMFSKVIDTFVGREVPGLDEQLLNLELLAYNFNESLNVAPLFGHLRERIRRNDQEPRLSEPRRQELFKRLNSLAREVAGRQALALQSNNAAVYEHVAVIHGCRRPDKDEEPERYGCTLAMDRSGGVSIDGDALKSGVMQLARLGDKHHFCYRLDILEIDPGLKSLRIKLELTDPIATDKVSAAATSATGTAAHPAEDTPAVTPVDTAAAAPAETSANIADRVCTRPDLPWREARFGLDFFNFPMIDNTRLPNNYRLALVLSNLDSVVNGAVVTGGAKLKVVIFPEAYASLKDRTFFQDVLDQLVPEANPPAADGTQPATAD